MTYAKIIADSISPEGVRLTTMEVRFHRFVLAEFNTHRVFSRNSASSRAIPLQKQIDRVYAHTAVPVAWAAEQKGMQGGDELPRKSAEDADDVWRRAAVEARGAAKKLGDLKVHKSIANRLLEPFMWHTVVVTATAWENFFVQRCSPLAQPEIRVAAEAMKEAYDESKPRELVEGEWHLPYIETEDWEALNRKFGEDVRSLGASMYPEMVKISAARCARVSYLTQDGKRDMQVDLGLYDRLVTAQPVHWSPLEHVATPWQWNRQDGTLMWAPDSPRITLNHLPRVGNLLGWRSLRTEVEAQQGQVTFC